MKKLNPGPNTISLNPSQLKNLSIRQLEMIDQAIETVGDFGEVRLIIEKGRLRFLVTQQSIDALEVYPG